MRRALLNPVFWTLLVAAPALALTHLNTEDLLAKADTIVLGETVGVTMGMDRTEAQVRVLQVLKGPEKPGSLLTVHAKGGKVFIEESEPVFATLQTDLLFLQKTPDGYTCLNQADGQKVIHGRNIYPYHDNLGYSVPFKDYLKGLEEAIKGIQAKEAAGKP